MLTLSDDRRVYLISSTKRSNKNLLSYSQDCIESCENVLFEMKAIFFPFPTLLLNATFHNYYKMSVCYTQKINSVAQQEFNVSEALQNKTLRKLDNE